MKDTTDTIRKALGIEPQNGAFRTDNGVKSLFVGVDLGRDKSETVVCEFNGKGRFVVEYPVDPHLRSCLDWFDEEFKRQLSELFAKRVKKTEAEILAWIASNPICYMNPCEALLDGIYGVTTPATFPRGNICAERYEVTEFFLQFPLGLPVELKGIAV